MKQIAPASCAALLCAANAQTADAPKAISAQVFSADTTITGQKIEVPNDPHVVVSITTFPPGAALPVHKHPYPHYVYVLEGTLTVTNVETGKSFDLPQGKFLVEMNNTWHFGKNNTQQPVKLLVIDQLPEGAKSNVVLKDASVP
jgi:quercetin dioxygenase-like cupin family protein